MSMKYLGSTIDIHLGATDLIFPHHQNEIAQSEAVTGKQFVRFWLHRGFLKVDGKKMSKSEGNVYVLSQLFEKVSDPTAFRYLILTNHYRLGLNFTFASLEAAYNALKKLRFFVRRISEIKTFNDATNTVKKVEQYVREARNNFEIFMADDLNTPKAIATIFKLISQINVLVDREKLTPESRNLVINFMYEIDRIWGFLEDHQKAISDSFKKKIDRLIKDRNTYRIHKKWDKADRIRRELEEMGVNIEDTIEGSRWRFH